CAASKMPIRKAGRSSRCSASPIGASRTPPARLRSSGWRPTSTRSRARPAASLVLGLETARHEVGDRDLRRLVSVKALINLLGDGHPHAFLLRQLARRAGGAPALSPLRHARWDLGLLAPAPELDPPRAIAGEAAGARQPQFPLPGQARQ